MAVASPRVVKLRPVPLSFGTAAPQPPAVPEPDPTVAAFMGIMDRLEQIIDAETDSLTRNLPDRIGESGQRKRQGLLELGRAMRHLRGKASPEVQDRLNAFSGKLENNRRMLDIHLRAVRDVADLIARSLREMDSDGTYTRMIGRP
jgi:hypothetical protein